MLPFPLLRKLGVYVDENFLPQETCCKMLPQLRHSQSSNASVGKNGDVYVNKKTRKTKLLSPLNECQQIFQSALTGLKPKLEDFFQLQLTQKEDPQFLRYQQGDFFIPHTDADLNPESLDYQNRKISVVCFLNSEIDSPLLNQENYHQGELILYGLLKAEKAGIPIHGQSGLLLAFPSDLMHEVNPVAAGERYSIVTWFH